MNDEEKLLIEHEKKASIFNAAVGEDVELVRPDYDFKKYNEELSELQYKIRIVKHALNVFNNTTVLEEFNMTIDQALVALPQLNYRQATLRSMIARPPIERVNSYGSGRQALIDYRYANYSIEDAKKLYEEISDQIAALQLAVDEANLQQTIEIDINE
jgi:hypothetical protein